MKNNISNYFIPALLIYIIAAGSCERKVDELALATYPTSPEVFTDGFSAGLYYAAYGTSKVTAFSVDKDVKYKGSASMKFEVPDAGDPFGSYVGGVYGTNPARDLSGYNVLTFWAKASQPAILNEVGFGNDMGESKYKVSLTNLAINSNWAKYYIPLPDPSVLKQERGMFFYAASPQNGRGYTFWIDEVQFENIGTIAHSSFGFCKGKDSTITALAGSKYNLNGLSYYAKFNLPSGIDQLENIAISYFSFASSNPSSPVSSSNIVSFQGDTVLITAKMGNVDALGSLKLTANGPSGAAPTPAVAAADVLSLYSNAYTPVQVDSYDPYWAPWMTTDYSTFKINENDVIRYTNFNDIHNEKKVYVAITFETVPIDISAMTYLHLDVWTPDVSTNKFTIKLEDFGANGVYGGGDDSEGVYNSPSTLAPKKWVSIEIPMSGFTGFKNKAHVAQMLLDNFPIDIYVDNIYFHK